VTNLPQYRMGGDSVMTSTKASIQQRQDDECHYCVAVRFDHVGDDIGQQ
jgi:hypothetical protein